MMNEIALKKNNAVAILQRQDLRITPSRLNLLTILINAGAAVPVSSIRRKIKGTNRITLYKTLITLEKKELIYKFFDREGTVYYAICNRDSISKQNIYIHFICLVCRRIFASPTQTLCRIRLPKTFKARRFVLCILGRCRLCR
jgi:Fur family ferric uptake transcriptional regulator